MSDEQLDLFFGGGWPGQERSYPRAERFPVAWETVQDEELIAALPEADLADALAIVGEIGRRELVEAVPELERLCLQFRGFGLRRLIPDQAAALDAFAVIGGRVSAEAVARLIARGAFEGPGLRKAVRVAADLGAGLPSETVLRLLRGDDPEIRAAACRCLNGRPSLETLSTLLDLLEDLHPAVQRAAACALGRAGRSEARPYLVACLQGHPSPEVVEATAPVADEECIVLLGRLGRQGILVDAVLDALDGLEDPRASEIASALAAR